MTNQEAIEILQEEHEYCLEPCYVLNAIEKAISALRSEPTGEPLTLEQLREMDGRCVKVVVDEIEPLEMLALVEATKGEDCVLLRNNLGGVSEFYSDNDLMEDGIKAYAYPPAHIDRDAWEPCEVCGEQDDPCYKDGCFKENAPKCEYRCDKYLAWRRNLRRIRLAKFCPKCGRPLTPEAWAMLEKRLRG